MAKVKVVIIKPSDLSESSALAMLEDSAMNEELQAVLQVVERLNRTLEDKRLAEPEGTLEALHELKVFYMFDINWRYIVLNMRPNIRQEPNLYFEV